jgi:hypothetical protein
MFINTRNHSSISARNAYNNATKAIVRSTHFCLRILRSKPRRRASEIEIE